MRRYLRPVVSEPAAVTGSSEQPAEQKQPPGAPQKRKRSSNSSGGGGTGSASAAATSSSGSSKSASKSSSASNGDSAKARKSARGEDATAPAARRRILPDPPTEAELQQLRDFDLRARYGPTVGISRLVRWRRAERLGLRPPSAVGGILARHKEDNAVMTSVMDTVLKETGLGIVPKVPKVVLER
jgi:hypothetical protein